MRMAVQMPAMKKLVLIGDSIRMGYEATVRTELAGLADIWTPAENGQHTVNLLLRFYEWVVQQKPDVLHINAGLWDTRNVIRGQPGNIVPLEIYRLNVRRLLAYCKANAAKVMQRHTQSGLTLDLDAHRVVVEAQVAALGHDVQRVQQGPGAHVSSS